MYLHRSGISQKELDYAKLAAKDRISFYTISKSEVINRGLANDFEPYVNHVSVAKAVQSCANKWKANIKVSLEEELNRGTRFSASLDEYTSKAHSRFMNLNLHRATGKPIGLGMIRVRGSLPADKAAEMVSQKLSEFGINEERHIVGIVTDGAAVMKKMGKSFKAFQQLCHAHGIHLAVCDLLYEKPRKKRGKNAAPRLSGTFQTESGTDSGTDTEAESDGNTSEGEGSDCEEPNEGYCLEVEEPDPKKIVFLPEVNAIIQMVRNVVKIFSGSPVNNNILQAEVVRLPERKGKELKLKLDCKTRWNTIVGKE